MRCRPWSPVVSFARTSVVVAGLSAFLGGAASSEAAQPPSPLAIALTLTPAAQAVPPASTPSTELPAASTLAGAPRLARGDAADTSEVPLTPTVVGDVELGVFAESRPDRNTASISPQVRLGMRPRPEVELHLSFGAVTVFADGPTGREQVARPSNLGLGASRVLDRREGSWRYAKLGFGFVLPTAFATNATEQQAYDYALGGRAGWDPWTWTPQSFAMVVPAEVRAQAGRRWVIGGDGGLAAFLPSAHRTDGLALAAQIAAEARVLARRFGVGVRLSAVWNGRHPTDRSQAAVSPFVDASLCRRSAGRRLRAERARTSSECPVYATARLNVNLDGPYGFTGLDAMRVWGVQAGLGWAVY
jgi:hypothetical protein